MEQYADVSKSHNANDKTMVLRQQYADVSKSHNADYKPWFNNQDLGPTAH